MRSSLPVPSAMRPSAWPVYHRHTALTWRSACAAPRVAEGLSLRTLACGGIDISDGLAADLGHLLSQSGCGATVYLERLTPAPVAGAPCTG
jgi:thiamine monophosphate kinase